MIDFYLMLIPGRMTKSYFKQEHDLGICCVFCFLLLVKNNCVESWIIYKINGWFCLQRREEPRLLGLGRNTQTVSRWELTLIFPLQLSVTDAVYVVLLSVLPVEDRQHQCFSVYATLFVLMIKCCLLSVVSFIS